jgi:hypothetical protein
MSDIAQRATARNDNDLLTLTMRLSFARIAQPVNVIHAYAAAFGALDTERRGISWNPKFRADVRKTQPSEKEVRHAWSIWIFPCEPCTAPPV